MVPRERHLADVRRLLRQFPIVAILGARQVGKTTLALKILRQTKPPGERFDLEDPADLARLSDPKLALADLKGLVVIDEIQRRPDIFPVLRVLADRRPRRDVSIPIHQGPCRTAAVRSPLGRLAVGVAATQDL